MCRRAPLALLCLLLCLTRARAQAPATCSFKLFKIANSWTIPNGVDSRGTTVGLTLDAYGSAIAFVRYGSGKVVRFAAPNSIATSLQATNSRGVSVGWFSDNTGSNRSHGLIVYGPKLVKFDLPGAKETRLNAINESDEILGAALTGYGFDGFLLRGKQIDTIHFPGSDATWPAAINDFGDIVGWYWAAGIQHGFVLSKGNYVQLDAGPDTALTGINNAGQIIGIYFSQTVPQSFIYSNQKFVTFDVPSADSTNLLGTNSNGLLTGSAMLSDGLSGFVGTCETKQAMATKVTRSAGRPDAAEQTLQGDPRR